MGYPAGTTSTGGADDFDDGPGAGRAATADVGVLTVLDQEIRAVTAALRHMYDYRERRLDHGPAAHEAWLPSYDGRRVRVAAVRTDSAETAYRGLVEQYNPSTVLLVGVAGGVNPTVRVGDVVLSDEVTAAGGGHRGGRAAEIGHRLNDFFAATPATQHRPSGISYRIHRGPTGSGVAVTTDAGTDIRRWLREFNERVLAVETEAAGVAVAFHEKVRRDGGARGWLTVRGIADAADKPDGYDYHDLAAQHAAEVMAMLVPFLHCADR